MHGIARFWSAPLVVVSLVLALAGAGAVTAAPPPPPPPLPPLAGSTFEGGDGNITPGDFPGGTDWQTPNLPHFVYQLDLPSGSADNAFGQGAKEDIPNPTVVFGSIPPNKSDLSRFYVAFEKSTIPGPQFGNLFVYLAWERFNVLGSANMDFELNKNQTPGPNGVTPERSAGDVLITFDFVNGGGRPVLGLNFWLPTLGPTDTCFASNTAPCWGNHEDLTGLGIGEAAVWNPSSGASFTDNVVGIQVPAANVPDVTISPLEFGEASVNLTAAGVIPPNTCKAFGSAFLKSRSSASFTAELKDFIAPKPLTVDTCAKIIVKKVTDPSPDPTGTSFAYTTGGGLNPTGFNLKNGGSLTFADLLPGLVYSVAETVPAGWDLTSATCDNGNSPSAITPAESAIVTCTFTNTARGTIIVEKKTVPPGEPDQFSFTGTAAGTIGDLGLITVGNLVPGTYTSTEADPTPAYDLTAITCDDGASATPSTWSLATRTATFKLDPGETVKCTFTNTKRANIKIHKQDDAGAPLAGAVFGAYYPSVDQAKANEKGTCTTDASGNCTIANLLPNLAYIVHEDTGVPGYQLAPDQTATPGPGATIDLIFVDPRLFKVLVIVCKEADNSLYASSITLDGVTKTTVSGGAIPSSVCSVVPDSNWFLDRLANPANVSYGASLHIPQ